MNKRGLFTSTGLIVFLFCLSVNLKGQVSDVKLLALIKNQLGVEQGASIPEDKLDSLIYLDAGSLNISDVTGLDNFTNLAVIDFSNSEISDLTSLANLPNLSFVNLANNRISDASVLASSVSEHLIIVVRDNCIADFTSIDNNQFNPIELIGSDEQKVDCHATQNINILYTFQSHGKEGEIEFIYRGLSTNAELPTISFGDGITETAIMDGLTQVTSHVYSDSQTDHEAVLSLGDQQMTIDLSFALKPIDLLLPSNETQFEYDPQTTTIEFEWSAISNAAYYEIGIYERDILLFNDISTTNSYISGIVLEVGNTYSWRVRSWSDGNSGLWSEFF